VRFLRSKQKAALERGFRILHVIPGRAFSANPEPE
jgi:hypothetical protein